MLKKILFVFLFLNGIQIAQASCYYSGNVDEIQQYRACKDNEDQMEQMQRQQQQMQQQMQQQQEQMQRQQQQMQQQNINSRSNGPSWIPVQSVGSSMYY